MKVSVLISAYNRPQWLGEAISSVLQSTHQDIEIVVRNSSVPEFHEAVDRIASGEWNRKGVPFKVKLIHGINKNAPHSVNAMWDEASGDYIMTLPDDDKVHPTLIERLVGLIPYCELACAQPRLVDSEGNLHVEEHDWHHISLVKNMSRKEMRNAMYNGTPFVGGTLCRKSLKDRIGPMNETLHNLSDLDFYLRVLEIGEIRVIEELLYDFRIHDSNTSMITPKTTERFTEEIRRIHRRHFSKQVENLPSVMDYLSGVQ